MRRWIFKTLSVTLLMLCVIVLAVWISAQFRSDVVGWAGWQDQQAATWHGGAFGPVSPGQSDGLRAPLECRTGR